MELQVNQISVVILGLICLTGNISTIWAQNSEEPLLLFSYTDDFSTEKARLDSYDYSVFWVYGSYPPDHPYLAYASVDTDHQGLIFRGYKSEPAVLAYKLPINPNARERFGPLTVRIDLDFGLLGNEDPGNPRTGYLMIRSSPDGFEWSQTQSLERGKNALEGRLEDMRYLQFKGMHAFLTSLKVNVYMPNPAWVVPVDAPNIQSAINLAQDGDVIMVRDGVYKGQGNVDLSFSAVAGKHIVLMSENGPENCVINCEGKARGFTFDSGEDRDTVIDGFTIENARAEMGAAISCIDSSPTIINCIFSVNQASSTSGIAQGGGVFCQSGSPLIRRCQFLDNTAGQGGGLYLSGLTGAKIVQCTFARNQSSDAGGGLYVGGSSTEVSQPLLRQSIFCNNTSVYGGGIYISQALPEIVNCTLYGNQAQVQGIGGGLCVDVPNPANITPVGVRNCILWGNEPGPMGTNPMGYVGLAFNMTYCDMDTVNPWQGVGNINEDPGFASLITNMEDFHLESTAGRWLPDSQTWVYDSPSYDSPCIDTGDPNDSIGAEGQPHGDRINMGAYGGTLQASKGAGRRVFHVDQAQGSDSNKGTSLHDAFRTINRAKLETRNGDVIFVWPGLYEESVYLDRISITIQSAADAAVIKPPLDQHAFYYFHSEARDCILRNFVIMDCTKSAILMQNASPTLENLTLVNNYLGINANEANPRIRNCIFRGNTVGDLQNCTVDYSCLEEPDIGKHNINRDPLFVDPNNLDFHLKSRYGRYWGDYGVWVVDSVTSSCIDAGDPCDYPVAERQENGGRLNLGAYGGTQYASLSTPFPSADLNNDGFVDFLDLALLADSWLQYTP